MRVLFLSTPHAKDVLPMVPLAWALRAAGHDVAIATSGLALQHGSGLPTIDFGPADPGSPEVIPLRGDDRRMTYARLRTVEEGWSVLAKVAAMFADPMIKAARSWRPDLIVCSQLQGAGALAGAALGVPVVEHGFGLLRTGRFFEALPQLVPGTMRRFGLGSIPPPRAMIDIAPPSMVSKQDGSWLSRFIPHNGGGTLPAWLRDEGTKQDTRRVVLTVGSMGILPEPNRDADQFIEGFLGRLATTARDVDAELLLLGVDAQHPGIAALPPNVRVLTGWVPLRELLTFCSAIVHQGGAGTMLNALDAGIPQFTMPVVAPNHIHSIAMTERGVGWWAEIDDLDADVFRRLLEDGALAKAAREVREEIAATAPPITLVPSLEALVR